MKTAYKIDEVNGGLVNFHDSDIPRPFYATDFSSDKRPEGQYICTCCGETVHWRKSSKASGNDKISDQPACWVADNRDNHLEKRCTEVSTEEFHESFSAKCTLNQAIMNPEIMLLLRLNFDTRDQYQPFGRSEKTHERIWCNAFRNNYKGTPCNSLDEVIEFLNKTFSNAPDGQKSIDRIMVSHGGYTRKLSQVLLLDPSERESLYHTLSQQDYIKREDGYFVSGAFPCIIPFGLSYYEKRKIGDEPTRIFNMASDRYGVREVYRFKNLLSPDVVLQKSGMAIAWPYLKDTRQGQLMWYVHDLKNMSQQRVVLPFDRMSPAPKLQAAE